MILSRLPFCTMMMASVLAGGFGSCSALAQQSSGKGQGAAGLPSDIFPDTLTRIPMAKRDDLKTEEEKQAFDRTAGPNGAQPGPVGANELRRYFPIVADHYRDAIRWIREKGGLEPRYAELAILVATRESNGQLFTGNAHEVRLTGEAPLFRVERCGAQFQKQVRCTFVGGVQRKPDFTGR